MKLLETAIFKFESSQCVFYVSGRLQETSFLKKIDKQSVKSKICTKNKKTNILLKIAIAQKKCQFVFFRKHAEYSALFVEHPVLFFVNWCPLEALMKLSFCTEAFCCKFAVTFHILRCDLLKYYSKPYCQLPTAFVVLTKPGDAASLSFHNEGG